MRSNNTLSYIFGQSKNIDIKKQCIRQGRIKIANHTCWFIATYYPNKITEGPFYRVQLLLTYSPFEFEYIEDNILFPKRYDAWSFFVRDNNHNDQNKLWQPLMKKVLLYHIIMNKNKEVNI